MSLTRPCQRLGKRAPDCEGSPGGGRAQRRSRDGKGGAGKEEEEYFFIFFSIYLYYKRRTSVTAVKYIFDFRDFCSSTENNLK